MENLIAVPMTYRSGHMIIAGLGLLMQIFGAPPENVIEVVKNIVEHTGTNGVYDDSRTHETFTIEADMMQLDFCVSAVACLAAVVANGLISDNPHSIEDIHAVGENLDAILKPLRVKGD